MPPNDTIRHLLALADQPPLEDPGHPARVAARVQWSLERAAAWRRAARALDALCDDAVEWMDDDEFDRLVQTEQPKVDAMMAEIQAATKKDRWPRELYWSL